MEDKGTSACIPGRKSRKKSVKCDKRRYKRCNRIEIMFGRLKDWKRVATRYAQVPANLPLRNRICRNRPVLAVIKKESRP